jgi:hypothetical protein
VTQIAIISYDERFVEQVKACGAHADRVARSPISTSTREPTRHRAR